jgi:hypothetical protein
MTDPLRHLNPTERSCLLRYVSHLRASLGAELIEVWLFGSFARGDTWPPHMPMNSDIDLLIVTTTEIDSARRDAFVNETYPLYLESGRQISPQFWSAAKFASPPTNAALTFKQVLLAEGAIVFSASPARNFASTGPFMARLPHTCAMRR